jgi:DNA-binding transcriptional LysR family regulator
MNLRSLDLNLLVTFDAVMQTRSVTRAAQQLNMAQPALSHALGRLRQLLDDELFIRTTDGMVPTPKAKILAEPVRMALASIRAAFEDTHAFQPESAERHITIAVNNRAALTLAAPLALEIAASAPGIRLDIRPSGNRKLGDLLDSGELDLAIAGAPLSSGRFLNAALLHDRYVVLLRHDHPATATRPFTIAAFAELPHLVLSSTEEDDSFIDDVLAQHSFSRRIGLRAPLHAAPAILCGSDMVAVMSRLAAIEFVRSAQLTTIDLPFSSPVLTTHLLWHRRLDADPAQRWLRETITMVAAGRSTPLPEHVVSA